MNAEPILKSTIDMTGITWTTASFGTATGTGIHAPDAHALREHLHLCRAPAGHLFALRCGAEALRGFLAARLITTLTAGILLVGTGAMVF